MNISFKVLIVVFLIFCTNIISATIINVPDDQLTIQEGINVAVDGDTVLVQPGTYVENINYNGKNITVASLFLTTQDTTYISQTIIDGDSIASVVTFQSGEDSTAVLCGLTITNGNSTCGGGIYFLDTSPLITHCNINDNSSEAGGGIFCAYSNPYLESVIITNNSSFSAYYSYGGGIYCAHSSPSLYNVTITNNSTIAGGGIFCDWHSSPSLVNITITGNSASCGGGIGCDRYSNPSLFNCILWNDSPGEIYISTGSVTATYSNIQGGWAGTGNIDSDPLFVGTGEHLYSLLEDSPCIDAGIPDTTGLNLPPWDIIGNLRIWDGDGDGIAIIDMGAYEFGAPPYVITDENTILEIPEIHLYQNYSNPFNPAVAGAGRSPSTTISFQIPENGEVNLSIYNIKGQLIKTIVNEKLEQGLHQIIWDGKNDNNQYVASGVYFYKLRVNDKNIAIKKCLLLK